MGESYTTCPCQSCAHRREAEAVWGDWGNFCQALECAQGARAYEHGFDYRCRRHNWRLGWLWARYENLNPSMRRDGQFKLHRYEQYALNRRVLCVASLNLPIGRWRAYIDAVPGDCENYQDNEWEPVAKVGRKLPQKVAEELFPELAKHFVWEA